MKLLLAWVVLATAAVGVCILMGMALTAVLGWWVWGVLGVLVLFGVILLLYWAAVTTAEHSGRKAAWKELGKGS